MTLPPLIHSRPGLSGGEFLARVGIEDPGRDPGNRLSHRAGLVSDLFDAIDLLVGDVDGGDRGGLGAAVAFERRGAELFGEGLVEGRLEFFGPDEAVLERGKLFRGRLAAEALQEGRSGDIHGGSMALDETGDLDRLQRVRVVDSGESDEAGEPDAHRVAEGMEQRQGGAEAVLVAGSE